MGLTELVVSESSVCQPPRMHTSMYWYRIIKFPALQKFLKLQNETKRVKEDLKKRIYILAVTPRFPKQSQLEEGSHIFQKASKLLELSITSIMKSERLHAFI